MHRLVDPKFAKLVSLSLSLSLKPVSDISWTINLRNIMETFQAESKVFPQQCDQKNIAKCL